MTLHCYISIGVCRIVNMSAKPTKMVRATAWSDDVEEAYRFQLAGYRDAQDYAVCTKAEVRAMFKSTNWLSVEKVCKRLEKNPKFSLQELGPRVNM